MSGRSQGEWESLRLGHTAGRSGPRTGREARRSVWYFAMAGALGALVAAAPAIRGSSAAKQDSLAGSRSVRVVVAAVIDQ